MKRVLMAAVLFLSMPAIADPSPFGLEIGKATVADMKARYGAEFTGINKYSGGEMYGLDVSEIDFDGLQSATVIFGEDGKLVAVLATLPKDKFRYLFDGLSKKYRLVSKNIPFVGNSSAKFVDGDTEITLDAPHLSFEMEMSYMSKAFWSSFREQSNREQKQKRQQEMGQL